MASEIDIDKISIEIKAYAESAATPIENLAKSVSSLKDSLKGIHGLESMANGLKTISEIKPANTKEIVSALNSIINATNKMKDTTGIKELGASIGGVGSGFSALSRINIDKVVDNLDRLAPAITLFESALPDTAKIESISQAFSILSEGLKELNLAFKNTSDQSEETESKLTELKSTANGIGASFSKISDATSGAVGWLKQLTTHTKKASGSFSLLDANIFKAFKRILLYRGLRFIISSITKAFITGSDNIAQFSSYTGAAMQSLRTDILYLQNSMGALALPILQILAPAFRVLTDAIVEVTNAIGQFIALLTGATSFTRAKRAITDIGTAASGTAKALDSARTGFDEYNSIAAETGAGGGAGAVDTSGMFETVEIASNIKDAFDKLSKVFEPTIEALGRLKDSLWVLKDFSFTALSDFYEKFLKPVGSWTLGTGLPRFIDGITRIVTDVNWPQLNSALATFWDALAPFAINIGEGLLWFYNNVLVPFGIWVLNSFVPAFFEAIASVVVGLDKHFETLGSAISWLWENALKPLANFIGDAILAFLGWVKDNGELVAGILIGLGVGLAAFKIAGIIAGGISAVAGAFSALDIAMLGPGLAMIGIVVGTLVALSDLSPGLTIALGVLASAMTALGVAMTIGFGPVGWIVGAIAGLVVAITSIGTALSKDCIPAIERFDDTISDATKEAVTPFIDMLDETTLILREMAASGDEITNEMVESIVGNYREMKERALNEITKQRDETLDNLRYIFQEEATYFDESIKTINAAYDEKFAALQANTELTKEEYARQYEALQEAQNAEILALGEGTDDAHNAYLQRLVDTQQYYADKESAVIESEEALRQTLKGELVAGESLNQESLDNLLNQQDVFFENAMDAIVQDATERETIISARNANEELLAKHHASEILKEAARERDEAILAAQKKYDEVIKKAEELRRNGTAEAIAQADNMIAEATRDRDETIKIAEEKYGDILDRTIVGMDDIEREIDLSNGEIKSKWSQFWSGIGSWWSNWAKGFRHDVGADAREIGENLMGGLDSGITSNQGDVSASYTGALSGAIKAGNAAMDIHSPSGVTELQGTRMMQGLSGGILGGVPLLQSAMDVVYTTVLNHFNNMSALTETFANKYLKAIRDMVVQALSLLSLLPNATAISVPQIKPISIARFADGGFPETGQLFIANEEGPELVGNMGNQSVVANQNQIVAGIAEGVAEGMDDANEPIVRALGVVANLLQKIAAKPVISDTMIADANITGSAKRGTRMSGNPAFSY